MNIILASSSPRRKEILSGMGLVFEVKSPKCDEALDSDEFDYKKIENIALKKALSLNDNESVIIAADTVVVCENKILGKPKDRNEALFMLRRLQGRTHFVVTSVALVYKDSIDVKSDTTYVTFNPLSNDVIRSYVDEFEPFDKAGAYGIQELPQLFIKKIDGSFDNVVGLPSKLLINMLFKLQKKA